MTTTTLQLPLSLPEQSDRRQTCMDCIQDRLTRRPGISAARVLSDSPVDGGATNIELTYDPQVVTLAQINDCLRSTGACLGASLAQVVLHVEGLVSPRHEETVRAVLNRLDGVQAAPSYVSQTVRVEFDRRTCALPEIVRRLDQVGVRVRPVDAADDGRETPTAHDEQVKRPLLPNWWSLAKHQPDLWVAALAGAFLAGGFAVHVGDGPQPLRWALLAVSYILGGWFPSREALATLRRLRVDIDVLMFAAAFGAAALGHFEEGAMLLFLFSLGGAGEHLAMQRARRAIHALASLAPKVATRLEADGRSRQVKVEDLAVGDRVLVRPGEQVPADGQVVAGTSAVNQAPITGESVPVDKHVGDPVFAGTINGPGALTVLVSRPSQENTLAKVIRMVEEAQSTKSPTQIFTDRVERWYVPLVLVLTACVIVLPPLLGWQPRRSHGPGWIGDWKGWFYQAMAFLTAASPCALAIGTPAAVLSGIARAARIGVLVKGGVHLENLSRVRAMAFDKTGTLTRGVPQVTDVMPLDAHLTQEDLLALAAAIERSSTHPIAHAIADEAQARQTPRHPADNVEETSGMGIRGTVLGRRLTVGRTTLLGPELTGGDAARQRVAALEGQGKTCVIVADPGAVLGVIALMDEPRPGATAMIERLRSLGMRHLIMLTGDNRRTAQAVANQVGVDECLWELLPQDKLDRVRQLDKRFGRVAMVGDGVNDAPALAAASVGIAMGGASGAGSDVALETADVALLANDLDKLPAAIGLSRFTRRIIIQNLAIALGVIAIVAPAAAMGLTNIAAAVLLHEGSTVIVVLNALRILGYRDRHAA